MHLVSSYSLMPATSPSPSRARVGIKNDFFKCNNLLSVTSSITASDDPT